MIVESTAASDGGNSLTLIAGGGGGLGALAIGSGRFGVASADDEVADEGLGAGLGSIPPDACASLAISSARDSASVLSSDAKT